MNKGPDWKGSRTKWITMTGLSVMCVTGWILLGSKPVMLGEQALATSPPIQHVKVSTQTSVLSSNVIQTASVKIPYKKGERVSLESGIPLFDERVNGDTALDQMKITYDSTRNQKYMLGSVQGDWMQLKSVEQGEFWLPGWYALKQSRSMTETVPQRFMMLSECKLYLAPGSSVSWSAENVPMEQALIVKEWEEWYGVSVAPTVWNDELSSHRPVLLWIKKKDIIQQAPVPDGWFANEKSFSISLIRHLVKIKLHQSTTSQEVAAWLGKPDWKEHSRNLNDTGYSMRVGQTWRYERKDAQLLLSFNSDGKLADIHWNFPLDQQNKGKAIDSPWGDLYERVKIAGKELPRTLSWKPNWVNQGNLNYTFLQAGTDDVLLMKGDDGGFSGFHYDTSIYALDRHTGRRLWRVHAGFGLSQAYMNKERDAVTIYTSFNPDIKEYEDRVRHMRLKDGKTIWQYKPKQGEKINAITAAKNVVIVDRPAAEGSTNGRILVLNSTNGKTLWTRKLTKGYRLLNRSADETYVLYLENNQLIAADPLTGRNVWSIEAGNSTIDNPENDSYFDGIYRFDPFGKIPNERWMLLNNQWVCLDLNTGKKLSQIPARAGQQIEVLHDGMVLIRENAHGNFYGEYQEFTTSLFNPRTGTKRWTVEEKIERGLVEGDQLYVIQNGYPAALDYDTGKMRWSTKDMVESSPNSTNQGSYLVIGERLLLPMYENLLVLNKRDGALIGRVHDVVMGTPEHRDREAKSGMINLVGNEVYVGSSNGRFRVLPASFLEGDIFP